MVVATVSKQTWGQGWLGEQIRAVCGSNKVPVEPLNFCAKDETSLSGSFKSSSDA